MAKKKNKGTQAKIISQIRDGILSGKYKPLQELPKRSEFIKKYNTTPITVQRAFNHLIAHGFVTTKSRLGTFVAEKPSNLFRYALVFARYREHADWTRFWQLMIDFKSVIEQEFRIDIEIYEGLENEERSEDYLRFLEDKKAEAFAGVIFTSELYNFDEELFRDLRVPCVAVSSLRESKHIANIKVDKESFHKQLVEIAAGSGCKRVALLVAANYQEERENSIRRYFLEKHLVYDADYIQSFSLKESFWVKRFISLMMRLPDGLRPDCLIVMDDNFLPYVFDQLIISGKTPGKDIHVISHANFPVEDSRYPGVKFVGYDVVNILRQGVLSLQSGMSKDREILIESEFH